MMMSAEEQKAIDERFRLLQILSAAIAGAVVVYGGAIFTVPDLLRSRTSDSTIPSILAAVGILAVLIAPMIQSRMTKADSAKDLREALNQYFVIILVGLAFREGAAILGFVASILTGDITWFLGLAGLTLVSIALAWPTKQALEDYVRSALQSGGITQS